MADFLPNREADLLAWSASFSTNINSQQPSGAYGLTAQQGTDYQTAHDLFAAKMALVSDGATNSHSNRTAKNDAKAALIAMARELVGIIQANPATTNEQRAELVITIPDTEPTPAPIPVAPSVELISVSGRLLTVRVWDAQNPDNGGRPAGVASATVLSYVGETPPAETTEWGFQENATRVNRVELLFPASVPEGSKVWFTAFWTNTRGESGPAAQPQSTFIAGGLAQAA